MLYPELNKVHVERKVHEILLARPGVVGSGLNGGFQALNLAVQFGARFIVLIGFDMGLGPAGEVHWHGRHARGLSNPRVQTLETWRQHLDDQARRLRDLGVEVVNASAASALRAYPKMTLPVALKRFDSCQSVSA